MNDVGDSSSFINRREGDPLSALAQWRVEMMAADESTGILLVKFGLPQYWLQDKPLINLTAIYCLADGDLQVSVTDAQLEEGAQTAPLAQYLRWADQNGFVCATNYAPIGLEPLAIAKPWGREIWYSGVEERGVCCFRQGLARTPVPWLQAVMPGAVLGAPRQDLVLLKILDPAPQPVTGDLYFELHEQKREVYVVTHVDAQAWPDGTGGIRYGFRPDKVAAAGSEDAFRAQYLAAVQAYEGVRRQIDSLPSGEVPSAELLLQEERLRESMNDFTALVPLRVGDVVKVPLLLPHSLQHGVRTIEFQTPVYERKILSFAQQVLTQDHWDTAEAVSQMALLPPAEEDPERLSGEEGAYVERIVDFEDFEVWRVILRSGSSYQPPRVDCYRIVMVVSGEVTLAGLTCGPEQAVLLPAAGQFDLGASEASEGVVFLLATPRS